MTENQIGREVVDAALKVHRALGPGLFESVYEVVLAHELTRRGLPGERQKAVPIVYEGIEFAEGFRTDLIVNGLVVVEIKSVENLSNAHRKQVLTYLRLTGVKLGFGAPDKSSTHLFRVEIPASRHEAVHIIEDYGHRGLEGGIHRDEERVILICSTWAALSPEERWWLVSMTVAEAGLPEDSPTRVAPCRLSGAV